MTSEWRVRWTKAQEARYAADAQGLFSEGLALFAVGVKGPKSGHWEQTGLMDEAKAVFLSAFANHLYRGMSTRSAFDRAEEDMTKEGRRRAMVESFPAPSPSPADGGGEP